MAERLRAGYTSFERFTTDIGVNVREKGRDVYSRFQEYVLTDSPVWYPPDFAERVGRYKDAFPIYVAVHKGHAAGIFDAEVAHHTRGVFNNTLAPDKQIIGSLLIVANTLDTSQPEEIVGYWRRAQPILDRLGVESLRVHRDKDVDQNCEECKAEKETNIRVQNAQLLSKISQGRAPILLVEGTVESGRRKKDGKRGEINGMVNVQRRSISWIAAPVRKIRREPVFIPIGTTGENRIYDPQTKRVPFTTKLNAIARSLPGGSERIPHIMQGVVGYPISYSEIVAAIETRTDDRKRVPELLDLTIGEILARLVPPHERGVYTYPHLLPLLDLEYYTYEEAHAA